ncbi:ABC transporter ATP-binding protein/permease [bacterium]|nr:ABC transporter ATP-binding protein/permease [bacterium]
MNKFSIIKRFWALISPNRKIQFLLVLLLTVGCALVEMVSLGAVIPFLGLLIDPSMIMDDPRFTDFFSKYGVTEHIDFVFVFASAFVAVSILAGLARLSLLWWSNKVSFATGADISAKMLDNILDQPYEEHISQNSSETVTAFCNYINAAVFWIIIPLITVISSTAVITLILGALIYISPTVSTFVILVVSIIYLLVAVLSRKNLKANSEILRVQQEQMVKTLHESLQTIREIKTQDLKSFFSKKFVQADLKVRNVHCWNNFIGGMPRPVMETVGMVSVGVLAISLSFSEGGLAAAIPTLAAIAIAGQRVLPAAQQMFSAWVYIAAGESSLEAVVKILEKNDKVEFDEEHLFKGFNKNIIFRNVSFKYKDSSSIMLDRINLTVKKGQFVGIVGRSGSGKSTILDIFLGLLDFNSGEIVVDGIPLKPLKSRGFQKLISNVPQDVQLLDQPLYENVAFGVEPKEICSSRVLECVKAAQLENFLKKKITDDNLSLGERGVAISGGERQRLGIARALYQKPNILVLDEATSALDGLTEDVFMDSLRMLKADLTVIMVAHRLSTVKNCDVIYEIESGKVINSGTFDELSQTSALFKSIDKKNRA